MKRIMWYMNVDIAVESSIYSVPQPINVNVKHVPNIP